MRTLYVLVADTYVSSNFRIYSFERVIMLTIPFVQPETYYIKFTFQIQGNKNNGLYPLAAKIIDSALHDMM